MFVFVVVFAVIAFMRIVVPNPALGLAELYTDVDLAHIIRQPVDKSPGLCIHVQTPRIGSSPDPVCIV